MMYKIGDRVKLDIEAIEQSGMSENSAQQKRFKYIVEHPDEVYTISSTTAPFMAHIKLAHPVIGDTSFFEEELILIGDDKI